MILEQIAADKTKRLARQKEYISEIQMQNMAEQVTGKTNSFYGALKKAGLSVIGEFKKASPSHGLMHSKIDLNERMTQYNHAVDAISCLTEEDHFHGSVRDLQEIRSRTALPVLRKDFILEAYQIYEARVIGADAVLLIAALLEDEVFKRLYELAYALGMDVLCEVHDEKELQRMAALDVKIIGINNRNLNTFEVSLDTTLQLASKTPADTVLVCESGVTCDADVRLLKKSGADAMLIGTALMESENPQDTVLKWKEIYQEADGEK